ncbi:efflux RND transporter periplasmic adaptor subunit [Pseudomonas silvicola]|nr:efflux RND transporter periplasmic adaptor subunit [Pseudomonas silvicola]
MTVNLRHRTAITQGLVPALGVAVLAWALYKTFTPASPALAQDTWVHLEPSTLRKTITLSGHLETASRTIITAPFEGTVKTLDVRDNSRVERGQRLASIDTTLLDIQSRQALSELLKATQEAKDLENWTQSPDVKRARRSVASATQALDKTQRELRVTRSLYEQGIVARMEVDTLSEQIDNQQLEVTAAQEDLNSALAKGRGDSLRIAQMELANAKARYDGIESLRKGQVIEAPYAGIVTLSKQSSADTSSPATPVATGSKATQGQALLELANLEQMQAVGRIEESDLSQIKEGMAADVTGEGFNGSHLQGRIQSIGAQRLPGTGAGAFYEILVALPPIRSEQNLRLGMSTELVITTYINTHALIVPPEAIHEINGSHYLKVSDTPRPPSKEMAVTVGESNEEGVEVFGVKPGDYVLTARQPNPS